MARVGADRDTLVKSYRYLRTAMVGVLVCLAAAVVVQSLKQDTVLSSISAYYYTPAQAILVAALFALGVCMIALQGTTPAEDILLNVGGMFAPVVALVPTARDEDARSALAACRQSTEAVFTDQGAPIDCAGLEALEVATRANVENNMTALLVAGALGLVATFVFHLLDKNPLPQFTRNFSLAVLIYLVGALPFLFWTDTFVERGHLVAAVGLFVCIVAVAIANAVRHDDQDLASLPGPRARVTRILGVLIRSGDRYAVVAGLMLLAVLVGVPAVIWNWVPRPLFWLEAVLIALFAALWIIQTHERWNEAQDPRGTPVRPVGAATVDVTHR